MIDKWWAIFVKEGEGGALNMCNENKQAQSIRRVMTMVCSAWVRACTPRRHKRIGKKERYPSADITMLVCN